MRFRDNPGGSLERLEVLLRENGGGDAIVHQGAMGWEMLGYWSSRPLKVKEFLDGGRQVVVIGDEGAFGVQGGDIRITFQEEHCPENQNLFGGAEEVEITLKAATNLRGFCREGEAQGSVDGRLVAVVLDWAEEFGCPIRVYFS